MTSPAAISSIAGTGPKAGPVRGRQEDPNVTARTDQRRQSESATPDPGTAEGYPCRHEDQRVAVHDAHGHRCQHERQHGEQVEPENHGPGAQTAGTDMVGIDLRQQQMARQLPTGSGNAVVHPADRRSGRPDAKQPRRQIIADSPCQQQRSRPLSSASSNSGHPEPAVPGTTSVGPGQPENPARFRGKFE